MKNVITNILAGGQGSRLLPLTKMRSKPAVPIAGSFRLIDIPISNCLNSDLRKIFISTQFSSQSLHRHIFLTYRFDNFSKDYVTILSAQQTAENRNWYQGTADAVRQNLQFLRNQGELVLILSGDHLYRMDYRKFIDFHIQKNADISISVIPVGWEAAKDFGVMKVNKSGRITSFFEKPKKDKELEEMHIPGDILRQRGLEVGNRTHLASMGIYVFNWNVLLELLESTTSEDFGKQIIPYALDQKKVYGYFFDHYWADIGTIPSFFEAHMDLVETLPKFNFYDEKRPIYTHARFLPGSKVLKSSIEKSVLSPGSIVNESHIYKSIIGVRSRISNNCNISEVVMMGADYFESDEEIKRNLEKGIPKVGIGVNSKIRSAIIDKNTRIGDNVSIGFESYTGDIETENYHIRDGIVVIQKNAVIDHGAKI